VHGHFFFFIVAVVLVYAVIAFVCRLTRALARNVGVRRLRREQHLEQCYWRERGELANAARAARAEIVRQRNQRQ
jgi:hypothetical protein